jgi:predicted MFS family arabinose efflux permease
MTESSAGLVLSVEMTASALTTLAVSAWRRPHSLRLVALAGALIALAGQGLSLVSSLYPLLIASRLVVGMGAGIVAAEVAAVVARSLNPERLFSFLTIAAIVNGALWLAVVPYASGWLGYRGPYACLLFVGAVGAVMLRRLPSPPVRAAVAERKSAPVAPWIGFAAMAGMFLTQLGQGSFWALVEVYGVRAGLSEQMIGGFLSFATLVLLVGVSGTAWAGARFGRFGPLLVITAVNALSILAIATVKDPTVYIAANIVQSITNLSSVVYQLGLAAALDRSGRLVAACTGLLNLGNGIGPSVAGFVATNTSAAMVGPLVLGFNAVALVLYGAIALGASRGRVTLRV